MANWLHSVKWIMNDNFPPLDCLDEMALFWFIKHETFEMKFWLLLDWLSWKPKAKQNTFGFH